MLPIVLAAHLNGSSATSQQRTSSATSASSTGTIMGVHSTTATQPSPTAATIWSMWNSHQLHQHQPPPDTKKAPAKPPAVDSHHQHGCFASQAIPKNSRSAALCSRTLDFGRPARAHRRRLDATVTAGHQLQFTDGQTGRPIDGHQWLAHVRLADDVQSINAVLEPATRTAHGGQVRVRCLRDLRAGDELQLWFSAELLARLAIPFLTPANIRGQNAYTCGACDRTFEFPNPLKMHLATQCGRLTRGQLWQRMASDDEGTGVAPGAHGSAAGADSGHHAIMQHHLQSWLQGAFQQQFPGAGAASHPHPYHQQLLSQPFLMFGAPPPSPSSIVRPSAFQPPIPSNGASPRSSVAAAAAGATSLPDLSAMAMAMLPVGYPTHQHHQMYSSGVPSLDALSQSHLLHHHHHHHLTAMSSSNVSPAQQHQHHHPHMQLDASVAAAANSATSAAAAAAHLETIVSNMGTKQQQQQQPNGGGGAGGGHLCIYCGKVYSRKYGLKIHIRTHTGFKPLKCPYCARPFGDPSNLNKHVRLHVQGSTIYKCPVAECDKILVRRRDLQRHMQTLHGDEAPGTADDDATARAASTDDGEPSAKRARSESSSPAESGGSSPSSLFAVDDMSSDDD